MTPVISAEGLELHEIVRRTNRTVVWRGRLGGERVVVKTPAARTSDARELARYRNELALLERLSVDGVVRPVGLELRSGSPHLILRDIGGKSLDLWLQERTFTPPEVLAILRAVALTLSQIHGRGVVHRDLNPSNIVWAPEAERVEIIDLALGTTISREEARPEPLGRVLGTPAYLAPEQTGRTNRVVDHRADLYALGATGWHLLVGRPVFEAQTAAALVHAHLARKPESPSDLEPLVPRAISAVILKLLAKQPEDRYQSAAGLAGDLARCEPFLLERDRVFVLGEHDRPTSFEIPDRLYGRAAERAALEEAFGATRQSRGGAFLLHGPGGSGKSALAGELSQVVAEARGYFGKGRFERLGEQPFGGIIQAIRSVLRDVLAEPDAELSRWKADLSRAAGASASGLVAMIPELGLVVESPVEVLELGSIETRNRINAAFSGLVSSLAASHPLVLVLDDLQWADAASLSLLEFLAAESKPQRLLLVALYRDEELLPGHPLLHTLQEIRARSPNLHELALPPLAAADVAAMLRDALGAEAPELERLSAALLAKSGGNPLFLRGLLEKLAAVGYFERRLPGGGFDLEAFARVQATDNVAAWMSSALAQLPPPCLDALRVAAAIGGRFQLSAVARVKGAETGALARELHAALARGMITVEGGDQSAAELDAPVDLTYRFEHDRVQAAAYALTPEPDRPAIHLAIGRQLLARSEAPETSDELFEVVTHLGRGVSQMTSDQERRRFAELSLAAIGRARLAGAIEAALSFAENGLTALGPSAFETNYELTLALTVASADAAYLSRRTEIMFARIEELIRWSRTLSDQVPAWIIRIKESQAAGRMEESYQAAASFLALAGRPQTHVSHPARILFELLRVRRMIAGRTPEELSHLPEATDPLERAIQEVQVVVTHAQASFRPGEIPGAILRDVRTVLAKGVTAAGAQCWTGYGLLIAEVFGEYALAASFGKLSVDLVERLRRPDVWPRVALLAHHTCLHWTRSVAQMVAGYAEVNRRGLEVGDFVNGVISRFSMLTWQYLSGSPVEELDRRITEAVADLQRFRVPAGAMLSRALKGAVGRMLRGELPAPARELATVLDAPAALQHIYASAVEVHQSLVFGDVEAAITAASVDLRDVERIGGAQIRVFWMYAAVTFAYGVRRGILPARRTLWKVRRLARRIASWVSALPSDRSWRLRWIEAGHLAARGEDLPAIVAYDAAMDAAEDAGFLQDAALMAEHAAEVAEGAGAAQAARGYWQRAISIYRRWGARAKVLALSGAHPDLPELGGSTTARSTSSHGESSEGDSIDIETIASAARATSEEIRLEALVRRLVELSIENAGAERGWLLLAGDDGALQITAAAEVGGRAAVVEAPRPVEEVLPAGLIRYVARSRDPVVLGDATRAGPFRSEPYVLRAKPRSVLCLPLVGRRALAGVIYLENNLSADAFTAARLEVLRYLSGQMAIALENARLYGNLDAALRSEVELTEALRRFVPQNFLESLGRKSIVDIRLGESIQKEMSVLFSDIRKFATLVEGNKPEENIRFINAYLGHMEPAILAHGGFIDSYIGDAIMALFERGADGALSASVAMMGSLAAYNSQRTSRGERAIEIGVGVSTGLLTLGTMGADERIKCGVIGDCVNLAARVESLTKSYAVPILTTGQSVATLRDASAFGLRVVDRVRVKGRSEPVTLYEVFDGSPLPVQEERRSTLPRWEEALALYFSGDFEGAAAAFDDVSRRSRHDPIAGRFVERSLRLARELPGTWSGVEDLDHK